MTIKIAIIADSHFDERSRFDECIRVHDWIHNDAFDRGCAAWLHCGDVYERNSTPRERLAAARWIELMSNNVGPGVVVRGNHDTYNDLAIMSELASLNPIHVAQTAETVTLWTAGRKIVVHCLPWPERARILATAGSRDEQEQTIGEALRDVLRGFEHVPNAPNILLSHAMISGSKTSHGQPLVGADCELGLSDLALCKADFYALGHVHMPQDWAIDRTPVAPVVYPGSPRRTAFGESEEKGYVVAHFDDDSHLVGWERIPTPCTSMVLLEGDYRPESGLCFDSTLVKGAEVRLRYNVERSHREAAKAVVAAEKSRLIEAGAVTVKVEEIVSVEARARVPEVSTARTLADQLSAYWNAQQQAPANDERDRLLEKLGTL